VSGEDRAKPSSSAKADMSYVLEDKSGENKGNLSENVRSVGDAGGNLPLAIWTKNVKIVNY